MRIDHCRSKVHVLLNYGIEEARFTKPVYPGSTIQVKYTVKEKVDQEKKVLSEVHREGEGGSGEEGVDGGFAEGGGSR